MGVWSLDTNWNPVGVPGAGADVIFSNSDSMDRTLIYDYSGPSVVLTSLKVAQSGMANNTISMSSGALSANTEMIGVDGSGKFVQTGGSHTAGVLWLGINNVPHFPNPAVVVGSYAISGNATLNASTLNLGGAAAAGSLNATGGSISVGDLRLGYGSIGLGGTLSGTGELSLDSSVLTVGQEEWVGQDEVGTLTQTNNSIHTVGQRLIVGVESTGTFTLDSGPLTIGTSDVSFAGEVIGYFGSNGTFNQNGGSHVIQHGMLQIAYGVAAVGTFNLNDGSLTTPRTEIGNGGTASFNQTGGTHHTDILVLGAYPTARSSYTLVNGSLAAVQTQNNGQFTQTGGSASLGPVDGSGSIDMTGGSLTATRLRQATLTLAGAGNLTITPSGADSAVSRLNSLTIPALGAARFDLTDNALIVDYDADTPLAEIRSALESAYAGGAWTGPGITSSIAASTPGRGLAYAEAAGLLHLAGTDTATWKGQTVDATSVLVSFALQGDLDLNGKVEFADLVKLAQNYEKGSGSATWLEGDLNYDGNVDFQDLVKLAQNYGKLAPAGRRRRLG